MAERIVFFKSLHAHMNRDVYIVMVFPFFFFFSLALRLGTRMPVHHCHLCRRNDTLPNCFSREINSALRPALLDPCHHGLITDFHLTPTSLCSSRENCIRCNPINAPSQYPPPLSSYNFTSITRPSSDAHSKGYMAWLNTPLGSSLPHLP